MPPPQTPLSSENIFCASPKLWMILFLNRVQYCVLYYAGVSKRLKSQAMIFEKIVGVRSIFKISPPAYTLHGFHRFISPPLKRLHQCFSDHFKNKYFFLFGISNKKVCKILYIQKDFKNHNYFSCYHVSLFYKVTCTCSSTLSRC